MNFESAKAESGGGAIQHIESGNLKKTPEKQASGRKARRSPKQNALQPKGCEQFREGRNAAFRPEAPFIHGPSGCPPVPAVLQQFPGWQR